MITSSALFREALFPGRADPSEVGAIHGEAGRSFTCVCCGRHVGPEEPGEPVKKAFGSGFTDDDRLVRMGEGAGLLRCVDCAALAQRQAMANAWGLVARWPGRSARRWPVSRGPDVRWAVERMTAWWLGDEEPPECFALAMKTGMNAQHLVWDTPVMSGGGRVVVFRRGPGKLLTLDLWKLREIEPEVLAWREERGFLPVNTSWDMDCRDYGEVREAVKKDAPDLSDLLERMALSVGEVWYLSSLGKPAREPGTD